MDEQYIYLHEWHKSMGIHVGKYSNRPMDPWVPVQHLGKIELYSNICMHLLDANGSSGSRYDDIFRDLGTPDPKASFAFGILGWGSCELDVLRKH